MVVQPVEPLPLRAAQLVIPHRQAVFTARIISMCSSFLMRSALEAGYGHGAVRVDCGCGSTLRRAGLAPPHLLSKLSLVVTSSIGRAVALVGSLRRRVAGELDVLTRRQAPQFRLSLGAGQAHVPAQPRGGVFRIETTIISYLSIIVNAFVEMWTNQKPATVAGLE